jgi:hypothetical protein
MGVALSFSEFPSCFLLSLCLLFCFLTPQFSDSLVVVVDCYTGHLLGFILTDDILVEVFLKKGGRETRSSVLGSLREWPFSGTPWLIGRRESSSLRLEV